MKIFIVYSVIDEFSLTSFCVIMNHFHFYHLCSGATLVNVLVRMVSDSASSVGEESQTDPLHY